MENETNKNFLLFISAGLTLVLFLSSLTACARSNFPPNDLSQGTTQSSSSTPPGMRFPDIHDFLIIKYNSKGDQIWKNLEDLKEKDIYVPLNLDESGNSYVLGSNYNIKYDSNGKQTYFNTFTNRNIRAYASALDEQGNIYLVSYSNAGDEIIVSKYDNKGRQVWAENYQYAGNIVNMPSGITLDKSGNVYVAGFTSISKDVTESKLLILKFDNRGNLLWAVRDAGLLQGNTTIGPVVDTSGNVYVTGFASNTTGNSTSNYDYVTVKYDTEGTKQWEDYYNGPVNGYDVPHDLKVDSNGDVIVTGESDGPGNIREIATIKYDSDGRELWVSRYSGTNGFGGTPSVLAIDDKGNIYITGRAFNLTSGDDYITIKYDSDGRQLWDARYDGTGKGLLNEASALFVDDKGNVYVTGVCGLDSQYVTYDTVKYSPNGDKLWVAKFSKANLGDIPDKLIVDALGNVYLIGRVSYYSN